MSQIKKKKLKIILLDKILKMKNLGGKKYRIREIRFDCWDRLIEAQVECMGSKKTLSYMALQEFNTYNIARKVCIDTEGLPYFEYTLGPINYQCYDELFYHNTGFACAMGEMHQKAVFKVLKIMKSKNHPIYLKFRECVKGVIKKAPEILEARVKASFFDDESRLGEFSDLDLTIFKYLTVKKIVLRGDGFNPNDYEIDNIRLEDKQNANYCAGHTKEEAAFINWYREYILSKDYKAKIENEFKKSSEALIAWLKLTADDLEKKGFEKIEHF
ncbi:MAG: hypothetical protein U9Q69_01535 [Nanoarchaeota archaeon]|nr:hypothetical protein [Nanoarchaeota archaeon]